uniref:Uncharacterized protein n=1 Tax=Rhodnius prolixus TaxID=13249 RepID=T1I9K4_RHOPR
MGQSCRRVKKISNDTGVRSDLNSIDWLPKAPPSINQAQNEQKVYSSKEEPRTRGNHNENQNTTEIEELGTTITTGYGDKRNKIFSTLQDIYGPELGNEIKLVNVVMLVKSHMLEMVLRQQCSERNKPNL